MSSSPKYSSVGFYRSDLESQNVFGAVADIKKALKKQFGRKAEQEFITAWNDWQETNENNQTIGHKDAIDFFGTWVTLQ